MREAEPAVQPDEAGQRQDPHLGQSFCPPLEQCLQPCGGVFGAAGGQVHLAHLFPDPAERLVGTRGRPGRGCWALSAS